MPFAAVEGLGRLQKHLADRFRRTRNHAWLPLWAAARGLFLAAAWIRYGRGWYRP